MILYINFIIFHALLIICGIVYAIRGKTEAYGGKIIEGMKVRLLGVDYYHTFNYLYFITF